MRPQEAAWIAHVLSRLSREEISPLLNIGSSTRVFRETMQPHIHRLVFAELERRSVRVIHSDLKLEDGVDVAGDIFDDAVLNTMRVCQAKSVLCSNMFEHVLDRRDLADRLMRLTPSGGLIILTVPHSYPYHADPIDTLYRPTPEELAGLFPGAMTVEAKIIEAGSYWDNLREKPTQILRDLPSMCLPFYRYARWKHVVKKHYWLWHPYQVTCLVLRKR